MDYKNLIDSNKILIDNYKNLIEENKNLKDNNQSLREQLKRKFENLEENNISQPIIKKQKSENYIIGISVEYIICKIYIFKRRSTKKIRISTKAV